ncbi:hypothetical protein BDZ89DRAFT_1080928, partial [Hymenopellis radicata]
MQLRYHSSSSLRAVNYSVIDDRFHSKYHSNLSCMDLQMSSLNSCGPSNWVTLQRAGVIISTPGVITKGKPGNVGQTKDMVILGRIPRV